MFPAEKFISGILLKREGQGALRKLTVSDKRTDFCSNDYIGFARSQALFSSVERKIKQLEKNNGSAGSRLLAGNSAYAEKLEEFLAQVHEAPAALVFNSGYDANVGLFSCLPVRGDTILHDELVHASIHDGIRLSRADSFTFRHNDIAHLEERLQKSKGNVFVAIESVYSMDGDCAPVTLFTELCNKYKAHLIVDEAHATGIFGMGMIQELGLQEKVYARIHTFGKALGCHGAVIAGTTALKKFLINYARSFIYTTALPLHSLASIECAYQMLGESVAEIKKLHDNIQYFRRKAKAADMRHEWIDSSSAIQSLVVPGNHNVKKLAAAIQASDMDVRPIMSPTVPRGKERIRVCLHSYNTTGEIDRLLDVIQQQNSL